MMIAKANGQEEHQHSAKQTMPGLRGIEHFGLTVPSIDEALAFFVDLLGCEPFYEAGPTSSKDNWMEEQLNVAPDTILRKLKFIRCGNGSNIELFEYEAVVQSTTPPLNSDVGGHHLAFYVDDFDAAVNFLEDAGIRICGKPIHRTDGPSAGQTWVYFLSPWGLQCELVHYPDGKGYERDTDRRLWHPAD